MSFKRANKLLPALILLAVCAGCGPSAPDEHASPGAVQISNAAGPKPLFMPVQDAILVLAAHKDAPLELKGLSAKELTDMWPAWVERQDADTRARIWKGEEDTLVNFLLFGTSFTRQPRVTDIYSATMLRKLGDPNKVNQHIQTVLAARADDLAEALAKPGRDERRLAVLEVATRAGQKTETRKDRYRLAQYALDNLTRYINDNREYAAKINSMMREKPATAISDIPTLYITRGLSTDTALLVDFAVQQAMLDLKKQGLLKPGSVRRAGVVGPGLDLIDKSGGYDLYPPQTTQPLVLIDTLLRLQLAGEADLSVTTFDISTRVNRHIERAVKNAGAGQSYSMNLIRDNVWGWTPEAADFWQACGDGIGTAGAIKQLHDYEGVFVRTVQVQPKWVAMMRPIDLNIVYQQVPLAEQELLDLIIATNILCYYGPFEQSLALRNAARMLRPGGILLSNSELPDFEDPDMRRSGSTSVRITQADGYTITWYQHR
jgi:SAM-dependent methyltransferase